MKTKNSIKEKRTWKFYLFAFIMFGGFVMSISEFNKARALDQTGISVEGDVIRLFKTSRSSMGSPIVVFKTKTDQKMTVKPPDMIGGMYKKGQKVTILYDAENPAFARIDSFYGLYVQSLGSFGIYGLLTIVIYRVFFRKRKPKRY